jgi:purine-nucleoside phosphorylase
MEALAIVQQRIGKHRPKLGIVLGSGLGFWADRALVDPVKIPYVDLPDFPQSTVSGHSGCYVWGRFREYQVLCMQGRVHYYEGYDLQTVTLPIRLMIGLGVEGIILTNAAGGIAANLHPGDGMVLRDHINFMGNNPLIGPARAGETRFPDMSEIYCKRWRKAFHQWLLGNGQAGVEEGVYLATSGPSFETPAEIEAFARMGADAVGMSTVPEAIVARHAAIPVFALSCITNYAAGRAAGPLSHEEVGETAAAAETRLSLLLEAAVMSFTQR